MSKSQNTFNKNEREKKKLQKRKEKQERKEERRSNSQSGDLENMMAYLDEDGNIVDSPIDPTQKKKEIKASSIEIGVPKKERETEPSERLGRVAFFNESKGYGFINEDGSRERYFVHVNDTQSEIKEGDKVSFKIEKGPKGMVAIQVVLI